MRTTGLPVAVPPSGNVHFNVSPDNAVAVNVNVLPEHIGLGDALTFVGEAMVLTVTETDVAGEAQLPPFDCVTR